MNRRPTNSARRLYAIAILRHLRLRFTKSDFICEFPVIYSSSMHIFRSMHEKLRILKQIDFSVNLNVHGVIKEKKQQFPLKFVIFHARNWQYGDAGFEYDIRFLIPRFQMSKIAIAYKRCPPFVRWADKWTTTSLRTLYSRKYQDDGHKIR